MRGQPLALVLAAAVALLGACSKEEPGSSARSAVDYAGRSELHAEFGRVEDTAGLSTEDPWLLRFDEGAWEGRHGEDWATAAQLGSWTAILDEGLWLEDVLGERTRLLPDRLSKGAAADGVEVISLGAVQTWYGTFEDAVTVEVGEGDWAGEQVLARDFGLVVWTFRGETRELAYYE